MLRSALLILLIAGPLPSAAGNLVKSPMILEEFGVYCPDEATGRVEAPDTERGFIDLIQGDPRVDFQTDVVPGELGLGFGMRFRFEDGHGVRMGRVIITHPPFGNPPVTRESYSITVESDVSSMTQFDFDDDYEIQYGTWTLAIEVDGEILLSRDFHVVPKEQSPISTKLCEGPSLLS
ncbi:hypothetical protein ATO6_07100 [Oceanicola sp. 22II-s10i]|nr:hypothetical protein ATO6_07100 [Oceanicola sp. 22II-s10i]